jgi:hypothetical protein
MKCFLLAFVTLFFLHLSSAAQEYIYTKEGRVMFNKRQMVYQCLNRLKKGKADKAALQICECEVDKLDRRFTNKQLKKYSSGGVVSVDGLITEDSLVKKDIEDCYRNSGITFLLQAESFEERFISNCIENIWYSSEKNLDSNRVKNFCNCQLQLVKTKKISDAEMKTLFNPNSILFYEMMYTCGNPFATKEALERSWTSTSANDVEGPSSDTVTVLSLNGMTYVKMKIGTSVQVWLFDTGASDLLVDAETEKTLKAENILSESNYLGTVEYEMANGIIDTCRRYRVNKVQIGSFTVNNILLSVTDKGKRLIVGKSLMNKFSQWILNNAQNRLILFKQ